MVIYSRTKLVRGTLLRVDRPDVTATGSESQAIVEYAPFQRVPTERKVDSRNNTIDKGMLHLSLHTAQVTLRFR